MVKSKSLSSCLLKLNKYISIKKITIKVMTRSVAQLVLVATNVCSSPFTSKKFVFLDVEFCIHNNDKLMEYFYNKYHGQIFNIMIFNNRINSGT